MASLREGITVPLVVDVDGTLVRGDLLLEGVARLARAAPHNLLRLPFWLAKGPAVLKRRVAEAIPQDADSLELNPGVVDAIATAQAEGREVYLATGADALAVAPLAERLAVSGCIASDGRVNLVGKAKAAALVARFDTGGFDYLGDDPQDLAVWAKARRSIGVGVSRRLAKRLRAQDEHARFLPSARGGILEYLRALRPLHWVKNALLFLPLVGAHETNLGPYLILACVFVAFSLLASGTYLVNDLLDVPHDRLHRAKRHRPVAAGSLSGKRLLTLALTLVVAGLSAAFALSLAAGLAAVAYLALTVGYSLRLKRVPVLDVVALALLYVMRVVTGGLVVSVSVSGWLLALSLFAFLALAIAKRQNELTLSQDRDSLPGRGYVDTDLAPLTAQGAASGLMSAVVFALYIHSPETMRMYERPQALWFVCPLLIYWFGRLTMLANRGELHDDPVVFAVTDRATWVTAGAALAAFATAMA